MNEKEKSLELAKLMGWDVVTLTGDSDWYVVREAILKLDEYPVLEPYSPRGEGLAQFGAILLQHKEVFAEFDKNRYGWEQRDCEGNWNVGDEYKPTQAAILDEILKLNGVKL